jgi:hypothetical protein
MKKRSAFFVLVITLLFASLTPLVAGVSCSVYGAYADRYLWRGRLLSDTPVLQPGISVGLNKFAFDWWGSYAFSSGTLDESDYRVSFTDAVPFVPMVSLSSGFWIYTHPAKLYTTNEFFGTLSADVPAKPYISYYFDPVSGKSGYAELGVSQELELLSIGLNGALNAGYNFGEGGYASSFTAVSATLGASYTFAGIKVNPSYTGQYSLNSRYKSLGLWAVNVSYGFGFDEDTKDSASK